MCSQVCVPLPRRGITVDPGSIPENWRKAENGRPHFELEGGRVFIHERGCLRTTSKTLRNGKSYSVRQVWQKFAVLACWWGKKTTGELRFCNKEMILGWQAFRGRNAEGRQFKRLCAFVSFPWRHDGSGNSNLTEFLGRWSAVWESWFVKFRNLGKIWCALFNRPLWVLAFFHDSKMCFENTRVPKSNQTI